MDTQAIDVDTLEERELDALVAERVMGWSKVRHNDVAWYGQAPGDKWSTTDIPNYSTDIAAAVEVMKAMHDKGYWSHCGYSGKPEYWPSVNGIKLWWATFHGHNNEATEWADTMPLAICKAALATLKP